MKYLVFQHIDVEHPGVFRDFWTRDGISWDAVELDEGQAIPDSFEEYDALVVMGGPMDVWQTESHPWLKPEMTAIRRWVTGGHGPFLGICLGHQLLAASLDGVVGTMDTPEIGFGAVHLTSEADNDPLMAGLSNPADCFQWHGAEVKSMPQGSTLLASNTASAVQAFRFGESAYGFQFHVEITDKTVPEWADIPEYLASLEQIMGEGAADRLQDELCDRLSDFNETARVLDTNFRAIVE
ncbi:MAG: type 1 glutamine amidotransferase, partial [Pseudomonadota bacterium]